MRLGAPQGVAGNHRWKQASPRSMSPAGAGDWSTPKRPHGTATGRMRLKIRRAARWLCRSEKWIWCAWSAFAGDMHGVAQPRAARLSPDGVRIRQAGACVSHCPDTGGSKRHPASSGTGLALRWRSGNARTPDLGSDTLPASARRPATGPFPPPPWLPAGAGRHRGQGSLRWLAWPVSPFGVTRSG
jgi:hypothetical protein